MRRLRTGIFLLVTYLLLTNPGYSQGTPAVLHCSFNGHLEVHSRSEPSSPVIAKIKCGDRLFVIEQRFRYPYVHTESGKDGFIVSPNHGQWSIDPEAGPPKDSVVATPAGTTATFVVPDQAPDSLASSKQPTFGTPVGTTVGTTSGTPVGTTVGTTSGTTVGTTVGSTSAIALGGPAGNTVGTTTGTAVRTAGATARTEKQLSIGPNSVAKSEESAGTKTLNKPSSAAPSTAAPAAAPRLPEREPSPDLPARRTQQQPEVVQQATNDRRSLPPQAASVVSDQVKESTASSERPSTAESVGPTSGQPAVLTNSDIVYLVKAHLSAEVITALIQSSRPNFETTPAALADLKAANVPDAIVLAMRQMSGSKPQ